MTLKNAALLALIGTILMTVEVCLQREITARALAVNILQRRKICPQQRR
jgi:hypothetical protein